MEVWKFVEENVNYQVSNFGNIKKTQTERLKKLTVDHYGYKTVNLQGELFKVHRLVAFAFCDNPKDCLYVDHIDRNRKNNHFTNLRFCTRSENNFNKSMLLSNTSGVTGVVYDKSRKKWQARIGINGKSVFIGRYESFEEATEARREKEKELFKEFAPKH